MKTRTEFPRTVVEWPDQGIKMPDGTRLSARIWLPDDAAENPVPAILEHLPYRKRDGTIARDELTHPYLAGHGYACIRVDMRGSGDSEGIMADEYTQQEWDDAIAVTDWVRTQPWSTGDWGMMGISWGGFNSLQLAALKPEGLKAIITLCSTVDRYADDIHYKGGCMLGENLGWAAQMLAYSSRPPDPEIVGDRWREMWLERLKKQPFLLETWLAHQRRDAYWEHGSVCEKYSAIDAAVLSLGGWHDGYRNTPEHLARNLSCPVKTIIGPWIHKYPHCAAPEPRIGFLQEALRWWDHWLKGIDTGVASDPLQRVYLMDSIAPERWVDERPGQWIAVSNPAPMQSLPFGEGTPGKAGAFKIDINSPQSCGDGAGEYFPFAYGPELPNNQAEDDAMSVCFDSSPLDDAVNIVGMAKVSLTLVPNASCGQIAVRLCDLRTDGTSMLISHGLLNLRHMHSHASPADLEPGVPIHVSVDLDNCAYRLPSGHRMRVAISTAYWPFIWPSPVANGVSITAGELLLPVHADEVEQVRFPPPEAAHAWRATTLRAANMTRDTEVRSDGTRVIRIVTDNGEFRDENHGLTTGSACFEEWRIHPDDPLSARGSFDWTETLARDDWSVRTHSTASLTASIDTWHAQANIEAFECEKLIYSKDFSADIPRDGI